LLINVTEVLALAQIIEINLINLVDHLPKQLPRLHVVVGVSEHLSHHLASVWVRSLQGHLLEIGEELLVNELQQFIPGNAFWILGPVAPLQVGGDWRAEALLHHLKLEVLVIDDLQEEHPAELG